MRGVRSGGPKTAAVASVQGIGEERQTARDGEEERENSGLQKFRSGVPGGRREV